LPLPDPAPLQQDSPLRSNVGRAALFVVSRIPSRQSTLFQPVLASTKHLKRYATNKKAIRVHRPGAPEGFLYEETLTGIPGYGELLARNHAISLNKTDVYSRNGAFAPFNHPFTLGKEAAGEVVAVGDGVTDFAPGDRVAFVETLGAYAEQTVVPEHS